MAIKHPVAGLKISGAGRREPSANTLESELATMILIKKRLLFINSLLTKRLVKRSVEVFENSEDNLMVFKVEKHPITNVLYLKNSYQSLHRFKPIVCA